MFCQKQIGMHKFVIFFMVFVSGADWDKLPLLNRKRQKLPWSNSNGGVKRDPLLSKPRHAASRIAVSDMAFRVSTRECHSQSFFEVFAFSTGPGQFPSPDILLAKKPQCVPGADGVEVLQTMPLCLFCFFAALGVLVDYHRILRIAY